jgi:hypothetical protein
MKRVIATVSLSILACVAGAEEVLREISWGRLGADGALQAGEVRAADGSAPFEYLELSQAEPSGRAIPLLTLQGPGITKPRYALVGQVRHEAVEGQGYLEMWSVFPGGGRYFSRTLGSSGPMRSVQGSSGWRDVVLPFFNEPGAPPPTALEVNLVLPGRGTVHLSPLRLVQYPEGGDPLADRGAWWGARAAGLGGGVAGSVLGCAGALVGVLTQKGKARALVIGLLFAMLLAGVVSAGLGVVALLRSQPHEVVYPLLLAGTLCSILPLTLLPSVRRRYADLELRRMQSRDLSSRHSA